MRLPPACRGDTRRPFEPVSEGKGRPSSDPLPGPAKPKGGSRPWLIAAAVAGALLPALLTLWMERGYIAFSIAGLAVAMLPLFIRFELRPVKAEEMVLIGVLAAFAAVSRVPFAPLPSVQPTSFVIIMAGRTFGGETGFLVGSLAAVVSNFFLGQGPWTPWQMFAWGLMGYTAGALEGRRWMDRPWPWHVFGFVWGFLFGWIMNVWHVAGFMGGGSWQVWAAAYAASFPFDLNHALANIFFLAVFTGPWQRVLSRVHAKYGLLD